ncbi:MAG: sortase-associated OmpA-like protein PdsO [Cellvibrionaceae bacterium]
MKKQLIAFAIASTVIAAPVHVHADEAASKEVNIGVFSGATVGAAAGGPVGAIVGAAIGGLFGDWKKKASTSDELEEALAAYQAEKQSLEAENKRLLAQVEAFGDSLTDPMADPLVLAQSGVQPQQLEQLKVNLQFKTNSDEIETIYEGQLKQLAALLKQRPDLTIHLSGFADRHGEDQFNMDLSEKRAAAVKEKLIAMGVSENSVSTYAFGESAPLQAQQDFQGDFYDRRVEVQFQSPMSLTAGTN